MITIKRFLSIFLCISSISFGNNMIYSKGTYVKTDKTLIAVKVKTAAKSVITSKVKATAKPVITAKVITTAKPVTTAKTQTVVNPVVTTAKSNAAVTKKAASQTGSDLNKIIFDKPNNKLDIELTGRTSKINCFYLSDNKKVVLDIYDCVNKLKSNKLDVNNKNILGIRNSQFSNNPNVARVVVDLNKKIDYKVIKNDKKITLAFVDNDDLNSSKTSNVSTTNPTNINNNSGNLSNNQNSIINANDGIDNNSGSNATDNNNNDIKNINKNKVTYLKSDKSIIHINNMNSLKYNLDNKTVSFQLDSSYDLSGLKNVSDDNIQGIEVISATTFNTVIITMKDDYQPMTEINGDGVNLIIFKPAPVQTQIPANNKQRIVVIDPGHGGNETGASEPGKKDGDQTALLEKKLNLDIALRVKTLLEAQNIKVYMTRTTDEYFSKSAKTVTEELTARAQYAGSVNADFFVSIHANSAEQPSASGAETLYYPTDGPYKKTLKKGNLNSIDFAQIVQDELIKATGAVNRNIVARPNLVVLKYNQVVPILVEVGFISNPKEIANLKTDSYKQKAAQGICNGIMKAYSKN